MIKYAFTILMVIFFLVPGAMAEDQHYINDDGTADTCVGGRVGDIVWMQYFDPQGGSDTISHVGTTFGSPADPSGVLPSSNLVRVYIWDDPNNDGDPTDAVLLGAGEGSLRNFDTNHLTHYALDEPVLVTSRFFVGARVTTENVCWPMPMDFSQLSNGRSWFAGDYDGGFNPYDLMDNDTPPVENSVGGPPGRWLLRAHRLSPDIDGQSFDFYYNRTDIPGWTEQAGDWEVIDRQLASQASATNQVITRNLQDTADGCLELHGNYGDGVGLRYVGAVVRYLSPTDRILVKLQDNSNAGYFDSCIVYDNTSSAFTATGENYGTDPVLQVEFSGTTLNVRIDVDDDGNWEHDYVVHVSTIQSGNVGASAYNQVSFDDWYCASDAGAWGGEVLGFDDVPQDYWWSGGGQNLGGYYHGQNFYSGVHILEASVYGYFDEAYPWHSADAVLNATVEDQFTVYFNEPKTHVGFWYTTASGDGLVQAFDASGTLLDSAILLENVGTNNYVSLDAADISQILVWQPQAGFSTIDDLEFQPYDVMQDTVDALITCSPLSGTLPFSVNMSVELTNAHEQQTRRIAGTINVRLANNTAYTNWRNGYTNLRPLESYIASWTQNFPALSAVVGSNNFTLVAVDVTPAPYNLPPYAPAGDAEVWACTIIASVP